MIRVLRDGLTCAPGECENRHAHQQQGRRLAHAGDNLILSAVGRAALHLQAERPELGGAVAAVAVELHGTEGRDQGSVVFPDAQVKFYLVASPQVRADRRTRELVAAGKQADYQQILRDIMDRDQRDTSRKDGPLVRPENAVEVDTSHMGFEQVLDHLHQQVLHRLSPDDPAVELSRKNQADEHA